MAILKVLLHGKEVALVRLESGQEYTFGRGEGCSVQLEEQSGISRQHFKVSDTSGSWVAAVVSKFGEIVLAGQRVQSVELSHGSVFKLAGYDFRFLEADESSRFSRATAVTEAESTSADDAIAVGGEFAAGGGDDSAAVKGSMSLVPSPSIPFSGNFSGNEDATNVGATVVAKPSLRVVKADGSESRVELTGKKWLAGREDSCEIFLPDRKASRRQFEITSTPEGYYVTDLGSANGTTLNGESLVPQDPRFLRSGDVLAVQSLLLYFEIRDPSFEKRMTAIPPEVMAAPVLPPVPRFEIINYPVPVSGGGALRVDTPLDSDWSVEPRREKKGGGPLRLILILIILGGVAYAVMNDTPAPEKPQALAVKSDALSRLTPPQRQLVKELYVTARNLHLQQKYENSYEQLRKLHELLPEGYEESKAMAEDCLRQRAAAEQLAFLEQERRRVDEQKQLIDRNVRSCNALANTSLSVEKIRQCLAPTIGLDPTNPLVADLIGRVERRAMERDQKLASQREHVGRVARGKSLYDRAVALQDKSEWYAAIDAFKVHIASEYPDPNGLKAKSQEAVTQIKTMLVSRVDELLAAAQTAYQARNYKEALEAAKKAKDFDSRSEKAAEFIGRVRRELNTQLRTIYEDAVLYEGVGHVKEAQARWRQILERDTRDGEYYGKASLKLKNYSEQSP